MEGLFWAYYVRSHIVVGNLGKAPYHGGRRRSTTSGELTLDWGQGMLCSWRSSARPEKDHFTSDLESLAKEREILTRA